MADGQDFVEAFGLVLIKENDEAIALERLVGDVDLFAPVHQLRPNGLARTVEGNFQWLGDDQTLTTAGVLSLHLDFLMDTLTN
ncbi:hypothetical protein D3C77_416860 [compost metagenome]